MWSQGRVIAPVRHGPVTSDGIADDRTRGDAGQHIGSATARGEGGS